MLYSVTNVTTGTESTSGASPSGDVPPDECLLIRFILHSIIGGCICVVGFIGNLVSVKVLTKDKQSPVVSYMLQWLAVTDNTFIALWALHFPIKYLILYTESVTHPTWLIVRVYTYPLLFTAQMATIWITVVIAAGRYVAVCLPYKALYYITVPYTRRAIIVTWLFAIVYNIPRFFEVSIKVDMAHNSTSGSTYPTASYHRTALGSNSTYDLIYFDILYYITSFICPLILLAFLNSRLTIAYRAISRRREKRRAIVRRVSCVSTTDEMDNNITLVMIIVVLVFILTQGPARIVQLIWEYKSSQCNSVQFVFIEISKIVEVLNSSVNFFIYCGLRPKFRTIIHTQVCAGANNLQDVETETYTTIMVKGDGEHKNGVLNGRETKILMETHDL